MPMIPSLRKAALAMYRLCYRLTGGAQILRPRE